MELLVKNVENEEDPRQDNNDKKELFERGRRPRSAAEHREDWRFIEDAALRENISYQMQYLEFQIHLYNDYQLYLTLESLHLKSIMAAIGGIVESALYALVRQASEKAGYIFDERRNFLDLINDAKDMDIVNKELQDTFHHLRKDRNLVHFRTLDYREYDAYIVDEVNDYIEALNKFITLQNT